MIDNYRHRGMRKRLVENLRQKGIEDEAVLAAMAAVPRHFFLDKAFEEHAYEDKPFGIGAGQTISQPFTVARMTELLDIKKGEKILEIGTGSGYQAAVLGQLEALVFTVERQEELFLSTKKLFEKKPFGAIQLFFRDGSAGLLEHQPFEKIIVTAGAPLEIAEVLKNQLSIGGRLVIPVGEGVQKMLVIDRVSATDFLESEVGEFRFVPFLKGVENDSSKKMSKKIGKAKN